MDSSSRLIYLDNAATAFPKPGQVLQEMMEDYARLGVSPGRGSYDLAAQCAQYVQEVRRQVCGFFGSEDPNRVIFTHNATDALNTLIMGLIKPGTHVVSSRLEHNSVLRPLHYLREQGLITFFLVPFNGQGFVDPQEVAEAITSNTAFVMLNHVSNVLGTVQPVADVGRECAARGVPLLLDVSQSAGVVPIDMQAMQVQAVAFTGHKSLMGPSGIGGLVLREGIDVRATRFGGTGYESWSPDHPQELPYRLEAGTLNVMGIMGLAAGLRYIASQGMENIFAHEMSLVQTLRDGLRSMRNVTVYAADSLDNHMALLTCNARDIDPEDFAAILDGDFNIATRSGLHCAPYLHQDLGTSPQGGVRFSFGPLNTAEDTSAALSAVRAIAAP